MKFHMLMLMNAWMMLVLMKCKCQMQCLTLGCYIFSQIARPLMNLLAKDAPFEFIDECLTSFHTLKKALISAPIIQPPDWSLSFEIMCDASDYAVGAILGQTKDKKHHAIAYASKTLIGA